MKNTKLSPKDILMLVILVPLLIGVCYYLFFYKPLQQELVDISIQSSNIDMQITANQAKLSRMEMMQKELDEIFARPEEEISEIAPYDNKKAVFDQLYAVLAPTKDIKLSFTDPAVEKGGTVRRNISMTFRCDSYEDAKQVIADLTSSRWRCLVGNLAISSSNGNMMEDGVSISATITFFEHEGLN